MEKIIREDGKILFVQVVKELNEEDLYLEISDLEAKKKELDDRQTKLVDEITNIIMETNKINDKIAEYTNYLNGIPTPEVVKEDECVDQLTLELDTPQDELQDEAVAVVTEEVKEVDKVETVAVTTRTERPIIKNVPPRIRRR